MWHERPSGRAGAIAPPSAGFSPRTAPQATALLMLLVLDADPPLQGRLGACGGVC